MINKLLFTLLLLCLCLSLTAQDQQPVLKTTTKVLSIKDGKEWRKDYWTISPDIELDVYVADKTNETKVVTFYSDIDSIFFTITPGAKFDFIVLLNGQDSCFHQIKSGITPQVIAQGPPTRDTIPFTLTEHNNISIQAILNQKDTLNLMFHTASSAVFITEKSREKASSLNLNKADTIQTWGGQGLIRSSNNNSLQIGRQQRDQLLIREDKHSGHLTDGKFGPNFFGDKVLELDFDKSILIVHSSLPEIEDAYEKRNLIFKQGSMFIEGELHIGEASYKNEFLLHSGFSGAALLDDQFVQDNNIGGQLSTISESELKDALGNVLKTKKVNLPIFNIGSSVFSEVPIAFFEGSIGRQKQSVIGGDLLKRFNIILDMQQAYIYLKPNELFHSPFPGAS